VKLTFLILTLQVISISVGKLYIIVVCTYHTDGFHGEKYSTEEQRYTVDGADWFAADERRRFPENVVENQRKTHDGHASGN